MCYNCKTAMYILILRSIKLNNPEMLNTKEEKDCEKDMTTLPLRFVQSHLTSNMNKVVYLQFKDIHDCIYNTLGTVYSI